MGLSEKQKRVLDLVRKAGVLRPKDLDPHNISRTCLSHLKSPTRIV